MRPGDKLLRPAEVAERLGIDSSILRRGELPGLYTYLTTPGGHRRFLRSDVDAYARAHMEQDKGHGRR